MAKKRKKLTYAEQLYRLSKAGLTGTDKLNSQNLSLKKSIEKEKERIKRIDLLMDLLAKPIKIKPENVLAFIMYDIEDNKVRTLISKYLLKKGYTRIQKSIFFGNINRKIHAEVCETLNAVNNVYENGDSILCLPISTDLLNNLKVIGKDLSFALEVGHKNVLFV